MSEQKRDARVPGVFDDGTVEYLADDTLRLRAERDRLRALALRACVQRCGRIIMDATAPNGFRCCEEPVAFVVSWSDRRAEVCANHLDEAKRDAAHDGSGDRTDHPNIEATGVASALLAEIMGATPPSEDTMTTPAFVSWFDLLTVYMTAKFSGTSALVLCHQLPYIEHVSHLFEPSARVGLVNCEYAVLPYATVEEASKAMTTFPQEQPFAMVWDGVAFASENT